MSRILRQSNTLKVNKSGFAWMADLISTMWQDDHLWATPAQVLYVVARDLTSRFQAVQQPGSFGLDPRNFVISAAHGYSLSIREQIHDEQAHKVVRDPPPVMNHAT